MKTGLIITLGTRDIQIDREVLLKNESIDKIQNLYFDNRILKSRSGGKFLFENYNRYKKEIRFPIVKPVLEYCKLREGKIDLLIIVTTDQDPKIGERFYESDTLLFGELIKKIISDQYKPDIFPDVRVKKVSGQINFIDSMVLFWQKELHSKPYYLLKDYSKVYICNQGGIDAINTGLLLQSLVLYRDKTEVLSVDEKTNNCTKLQFTQLYLQESERSKLVENLIRYQYAAVKNLNLPITVKSLASFAEHRLNFDFEQALLSLEDLGVEHRDLLINLQQQISKIQINEQSLLKELGLNAWVKFQQEAYIDFLLRFFRIFEEVVKQHAIRFLNIKYDHLRWAKNLESFLAKPSNETLKIFLENKKFGSEPLKYLDDNITTFLAIIEFFDNDLLEKLNNFRSLSSLRNNSIGAHSFDPVSKQKIETVLNQKGLKITDLMQFLKEETHFDENELASINQDIIRLATI